MAQREGSRAVFSEIAGHPALDLVNTVEWRLSPSRFEEDLEDYDDVIRWSRQRGFLGDDAATVLSAAAADAATEADAETSRLRFLRESIYEVLFESADPQPLTQTYREALSDGRLRRVGEAWEWRFPLDLALPLRRVAVSAIDLMQHTDLTLLRQCQDAECGWVFLDTSPRHNRRWCVSADCGNRNRVRGYYERARATR